MSINVTWQVFGKFLWICIKLKKLLYFIQHKISWYWLWRLWHSGRINFFIKLYCTGSPYFDFKYNKQLDIWLRWGNIVKITIKKKTIKKRKTSCNLICNKHNKRDTRFMQFFSFYSIFCFPHNCWLIVVVT